VTDVDTNIALLAERGIAGPIETAIVLGTGLGPVADALEGAISVPYADLAGFPAAGVSGHGGRLVAGTWEGARVAVLQGRAHYYETGDPAAMRVPLEVLARLGTRQLILTNSAGSLHADWYPGSLALISDHINFSGLNPLIGTDGDARFVGLADAYDRHLRMRLKRAAAQAGTAALREGVYMWFSGPSFETPAEVKVAKLLGADLVGMSTVPEVILARRLGLRVAGLSLVTNFATGIGGGNPSHTETKDTALGGSLALKRLLRAFLRARDDA
jgi:purine-nucleoside phosphorylase